MRKVNNIIPVVALMITATFSACKKAEMGPTGVKGDQGQQGIAGADGTKGDNGEKGEKGDAGTANVIYSDWILTSSWVASTTSTGAGKKTFYFNIEEEKITKDILDRGTVLIFAKFLSDPDSTGIVKSLPSIYYNLGGATTEYRFQYGLFEGRIKVICDIVPNGTPSVSNQVRYVIIPGGLPAGPVINQENSYEAVCSRYNIPAKGSNK